MKTSLIITLILVAIIAVWGGKMVVAKTSTNNLPTTDYENLTTSQTGLQWRDITVGDGAIAEKGDKVSVHYTGWLYPSGPIFDSSVSRGEPFSFRIGTNGIIQGWNQGVKGMHVGGKRLLVIPPELGYGAGGYPPVIPRNATLVFQIELLDIE
jgi:peptidylprolyl isomerase